MFQELKTRTKRSFKHKTLRVVIQKESLKKKIMIYFFLSFSAIMLRVLLQPFPSVEPLLSFIVIFSFFFGYKYSLVFALYAYYLSNVFMIGGNGVWTIFQTLSALVGATLSYFLSLISRSFYVVIFSSFIVSLIYEIIVNLGMGGINIYYFYTSLPFSIVHILSTISFAVMLYGFFDKDKRK